MIGSIKNGMVLILLVFSVILLSSPVQAAITINYDAGTTYATTALTGYSTYGDMMDGMKVTAFFVGGGSETAIWEDNGAGNGMAEGLDWGLYENGDTFTGTWSFSSLVDISKLLIEAGPGNTVFDLTWPDPNGDPNTNLDFGTDGSARGWTFDYLGNANDINLNVTYSDLVALNGNAAVGDLYLNLTIEFLDGYATGAAPFQFRQDTDNLKYSGDITPVSEPSMMLLFFSGLAGLAGFGWKFRK